MLTPVAAAKASFHDPVVSLDLAHSLNRGVKGCDTLLWSAIAGLAWSLLSGVERQCCMKSAGISRMGVDEQREQ